MTLQIISAVYGVAYVIGLVIAAASLVARALRYRRARWPMPRLLVRDLVLILGLALPFGGGLVLSRVFGIALGENAAWVIVTGAMAVAGIWVFVYNELFVIERPRR